MIEAKVNPGACGLKSVIKAESPDMMTATVTIESECPSVLKYAEQVKSVEAMKEVFSPFGTSNVFKAAETTLSHPVCPVPTAVLKAVEAACSLALPADVEISIQKLD